MDDDFVARKVRHQRDNLSNLISKLDIGREVLWRPARLTQHEHWAGHIPFAFWLIKVCRPRLVVELGTHRGNSCCAFCQAIASLGLDLKAFSIDTWEGDIHMRCDDEVLEDLRAHHDPLYGSFSTLMQLTFAEARPFF